MIPDAGNAAGQCACCGTRGPVELHHIGRRAHSAVTIAVCPACHNLLTIADVYERTWNQAGHPVWRVAAGFADALSVLAANTGLAYSMRLAEQLRDAFPGELVTSRVSVAVPDYPGCDDPGPCLRLIDDALEMWRAVMAEAVSCPGCDVPEDLARLLTAGAA